MWHGDEEFLAQTPRRRSECDWPRHHAQRDATHDRWRFAEPAVSLVWREPVAEVWTTKPFEIAGLQYERIMRGSCVLRVVGRLKPGMTLQQARAALPSLEAKLSRPISEQDRQLIGHDAEDFAGRHDPEFPRGLCTLFTAVAFRFADRMQQCCESVARSGSADGGARSRCEWRLALRARSVVRFFVFESLLVSVIAGIAGALLAWYFVPIVPKMASNFLPFESGTRDQLSIRRARLHDRDVDLHRSSRWVFIRRCRLRTPIWSAA